MCYDCDWYIDILQIIACAWFNWRSWLMVYSRKTGTVKHYSADFTLANHWLIPYSAGQAILDLFYIKFTGPCFMTLLKLMLR